MGKWIADAVPPVLPHRCEKPRKAFRRAGRRWQCDCGEKWQIVIFCGTKLWSTVCINCDQESYTSEGCTLARGETWPMHVYLRDEQYKKPRSLMPR